MAIFFLSDVERLEAHALLVEMKMVQSLWETAWRFLKKLSIELPYNLPLLGIEPKELKAGT